MIGDPPAVGTVIRYAYLWHWQHAAGRDEGEKDRPCAVVASVVQQNGRTMVRVFPITTKQPAPQDHAVELTPEARARLQLEGGRSWVVASESNLFTWPGPDLRPVPARHDRTVIHGVLSAGTLRQLAAAFAACHAAGAHDRILRDETDHHG